MNDARHVGNKQASCFYYQTMQIHTITCTPIVCKGSQNNFITIYEGCSIYDIPQVLDIKW